MSKLEMLGDEMNSNESQLTIRDHDATWPARILVSPTEWRG